MLIGCLSSARHRGRRDLSDSPPPLPSRRQVLPFLAELGNRHSSSNVVGGGRGAHSPPPPPPLHKRPSSALRSPRHSTVPDIVITRRRNSAYETVERDNGPPNGRDVCERRNSGGGLRRLDNWIQHLMHEG
ncbi:unnamed protein product, partial [Mesorhabditis belari]|uniref:Uncharacterized protein n=1 Tax=Mesorhabditis belari TaxID=2138241 RepID=A0AAF3J1B4_9BILA